jgi:hypothetical protein
MHVGWHVLRPVTKRRSMKTGYGRNLILRLGNPFVFA